MTEEQVQRLEALPAERVLVSIGNVGGEWRCKIVRYREIPLSETQRGGTIREAVARALELFDARENVLVEQ